MMIFQYTVSGKMKGASRGMIAARLHGAGRMTVDRVADPSGVQSGEVLLAVRSVGICGSDLHTFRHGRIGDTPVLEPQILGHEFSAVVMQAGSEARDGFGNDLKAGTRVAVDPAQPCGRCEKCIEGNPNLCTDLHFCGLFPDQGCLSERIVVPSATCFPVPGEIDDASAALLEPLGVALHAVDLAHLRPGQSVLIIGAGPIGLLILQAAKRAGAGDVYVMETLPWRLALAGRLGGIPLARAGQEGVVSMLDRTGGRGVDCVFEAAWAGDAVDRSLEAVKAGGRILLVGIPGDDHFTATHSTARRKGLTILFVRRMKRTYPRAIELVRTGAVRTAPLVSHRFPLAQAPVAFSLNAGYGDGVVKVMIDVHEEEAR
jgi:L-iditol 2-dehydrogenase